MTQDTVQVVPYDPQWAQQFIDASSLIKKALGENCIEVYHIGSTAIQNLSAKPIIDILPVVKDITQVDERNPQMQALGFEVKGEFGIAFRRFFHKRGSPPQFNVHVFEQHNPEIKRHLAFVDWLNTHEQDKKAYEALKNALAQQYPDDLFQYCMKKTQFVNDIDKKAGYQGHKMVIALMDDEWAAFEALHKQAHIETNITSKNYDPKTHPNAFPWVLYLNHEIVGVAVITFDEQQHAHQKSFIVKDDNPNYKPLFSSLLTTWIHQHQKT